MSTKNTADKHTAGKGSHISAKNATRIVAYTGIMTAMVMVATLLGFSTAQFYFNVGDTVILLTAAIFGPIPAMIAGGLGAFFADMAVYPATMLFTLIIKAVEGLVAGILLQLIFTKVHKTPLKIVLSVIAMSISAFLMMTGYFICQTFFYGTYAAAIIALPMDAVQASVSVTLATILLYPLHFLDFRSRLRLAKNTDEQPIYTRESIPNSEDGEDSEQ